MSLGVKLSPSICEIKWTGLNKEQQKKARKQVFFKYTLALLDIKKKKKSLLMPMKELGWEAEGN